MNDKPKVTVEMDAKYALVSVSSVSFTLRRTICAKIGNKEFKIIDDKLLPGTNNSEGVLAGQAKTLYS